MTSERLEWVLDNESLLREHVTTDPIGNIHLWEIADEPWSFLAACEEYYHCVTKKDRNINWLLLLDKACGGVQILLVLRGCTGCTSS